MTMDWPSSFTERRRKASISGRGVRVEVAGGLVGKDEVGLVDQRSGAGDALLLTAGHLVRAVAQPVADAELAHQVVEPRLVDLAAGEIGRKRDVLLGA